MASKLAELYVQITGNASPLSATLAGVRTQLSGFGGMGVKAGSGLLSGLGVAAATGGLAAVGVGMAKAITTAADLESAYGQIRKTTGLTGDEMERLKGKLQGLSTTMAGVSVESINEVGAMAGRLGIQGVEGIAEFTKSIAMITIALDDIPAEEAASSIARILNVFQLGPEATMSFASALNKLDDSSTATGRDILDVSRQIAGAASTLGMSPQKVLALSAALKDAGINNEVAGTAFSQILGKMAKDSASFAKVAGVSADQFATALKGDPLEAIQLLMAGLAKLDAPGQFRAISSLGIDGERGTQALLQLSKVMGKLSGYVTTANEEWKTHASIQAEVKIKSEETWSQLTRLTNSVKLTAGSIGSVLLPQIKELIGGLTSVSEGLRSVITSGGPMATVIKAAVNPLGVVTDGAKKAWKAIRGTDDKPAVKAKAPEGAAKAKEEEAKSRAALSAFSRDSVFSGGARAESIARGVDPDRFEKSFAATDAREKEEAEAKAKAATEAAKAKAATDTAKAKMATDAAKARGPMGPPRPEGMARPGFKGTDEGKGEGQEGFVGPPRPGIEDRKQATHSSLEDFARSMQEGIFGKDAIAKETLVVAKEQKELTKEQVAIMKKAHKTGNIKAVAVGPK